VSSNLSSDAVFPDPSPRAAAPVRAQPTASPSRLAANQGGTTKQAPRTTQSPKTETRPLTGLEKAGEIFDNVIDIRDKLIGRQSPYQQRLQQQQLESRTALAGASDRRSDIGQRIQFMQSLLRHGGEEEQQQAMAMIPEIQRLLGSVKSNLPRGGGGLGTGGLGNGGATVDPPVSTESPQGRSPLARFGSAVGGLSRDVGGVARDVFDAFGRRELPQGIGQSSGAATRAGVQARQGGGPPAAPEEGDRYRLPNGETVIRRNGKWEVLEDEPSQGLFPRNPSGRQGVFGGI
jgi:hypothetical protein